MTGRSGGARRRAALLLPVLLLTAACGSTVQVTSTGAPLGPDGLSLTAPTAGPQQPGAPGTGGLVAPGGGPAATPGTAAGPVLPGVPSTQPGTRTPSGSRVTTPISVGVLDTGDTSGFVSAFGFEASSTLTSQELFRGMVDWYNARGGIAQRRIKLVEYTADPSAASYDTEVSAACARFTQDNRVAVVLTQTGYQASENYETCLTKAGVPNLSGSMGGLDEKALARHPLLFSLTAASVDRSLRAELRGLTATGFLTKQSKIGVIVEACPQNVSAYESTFVPLAKSLGLQTTRRDIDCVSGYGNMPQVISQVSAAALPFRAAGIDRVTFVSSYQGAATVFFETQAASQGYAPSYALTSYSTAGAFTSDLSAEARARVQGVGWSPDADVTAPGAPKGATKRCRDAFAAVKLVPQSTGEAYAMDITCGQFFALEDALLASGGRSDAASLRQALESRGSSPFLLGGTRLSAPRKHDATDLFSTFGYKSNCTCFGYTGSPRRWADS